MTGGGFGGCTVSLVRRDGAEAFARDVGAAYAARCPGAACTVFATGAGAGARVLWNDEGGRRDNSGEARGGGGKTTKAACQWDRVLVGASIGLALGVVVGMMMSARS